MSAAPYSQEIGRRLEDERKRIIYRIDEMTSDEWFDFLSALEVASGEAAEEYSDATRETLYRSIYE